MTDVSDITALYVLREMTTQETIAADRLISLVEADLHARALWLAAAEAAYATDPTSTAGVAPATVSRVVARIVKRYLDNPVAVNGSMTLGSASLSSRGGTSPTGGWDVTDADLAELMPPDMRPPQSRSIRTSPRWACP